MNRTTTARRTVVQRVAPLVLVGALGIAAAACGSSGGTKVQNSPGQSPTPTTGAPTTQGGSSSGGAGF